MVQQLPVVKEGSETPRKVRPPVDLSTLAHRDLRTGAWWREIPAFADVDEATFHDHRWQMKHTITKPETLLAAVSGLASEGFLKDAAEGFRKAPMAVRVSPYMLSLVDWKNPYEDPIRRQFLPTASSRLADHPKLTFDSLGEQGDAPVPGLTHRYPDKALFLALDTCPVYCRFCTRSYAVGPDQEMVEKVSLKASPKRWEEMFAYVASRPELEDIVISGGDAWNLRADQIRELGNRLLDIDNVRRMRFASKGPAVLPQKLITDDEWVKALIEVVQRGRSMGKDVMLHTHFNHANEITEVTQRGLRRLFEAGVFVRNQTVLQRGVNDTEEAQTMLARRLAWVNVHPYYVYQHDMVKGTEELRTTVATAERLEKWVRGSTAGFNTPTFVVDAPGGGGKRTVHSYEYYDQLTGISVYTAPSVKPGQVFLYFDPIDLLPEEGQARWADESEQAKMVDEAIEIAREAMHAG
ncbi:MAG: KamA family radical SAM protein [Sandaracinus sp.]|nr:KamA family radical SAM protein [Sandaracinus sp.]